MRIAAENDLLEPARAQNRPSSPPSHRPRSRTRARNLPEIYQYTWYWPRIAHPILALLCGEWNALGEIERDLFRLWVPYAGS